jgi:hypothetical protein
MNDDLTLRRIGQQGLAVVDLLGSQIEDDGDTLVHAPLTSVAAARRPVQGPRAENRIHLVSVEDRDKRRHVWAESGLEKAHLMNLRWLRDVGDLLAQPACLSWQTSEQRWVTHWPDFLAERADGTRVLYDVKAMDGWNERFALQAGLTAAWCRARGLGYRVLAEMPRQRVENLRVLQMHHEVSSAQETRGRAVLEALREPHSVAGLAHLFGSLREVAVPLQYLMWHGRIRFDINRAIRGSTWIVAGTPDPLEEAFTFSASDVVDWVRRSTQ